MAYVESHDKQVGSKDVHITSLCYNGKRCQFASSLSIVVVVFVVWMRFFFFFIIFLRLHDYGTRDKNKSTHSNIFLIIEAIKEQFRTTILCAQKKAKEARNLSLKVQ